MQACIFILRLNRDFRRQLFWSNEARKSRKMREKVDGWGAGEEGLRERRGGEAGEGAGGGDASGSRPH